MPRPVPFVPFAPFVARTSVRRAAVLGPLAALSVVATVSLAQVSQTVPVAAASPSAPAGQLPDGSVVPQEAVEAPASISETDETSGSVGDVEGDARQIVATSSANGIPAAALAAYQRAESVINAADKNCHLSWQLVAAIGRVESDHGRFGGNALDADGVARPGIVGVALDGTGGTALIRDTDAGVYDGDVVVDRAVGPMQFIPSTWAVVGVDADNDGVRNPQDIDDAALGTAVYLCSGDDNLAFTTGQRNAVYRYNHSQSYVDLVLSLADAYLQGDYMSTPDSVTAAGYLAPIATPTEDANESRGPRGGQSQAPAAEESTEEPGDDPTQEPTEEPGDDPTRSPSPHLPSTGVKVPHLPHTGVTVVDDVLTLAQAVVQCTLDGNVDDPFRTDDDYDLCLADYTAEAESKATAPR